MGTNYYLREDACPHCGRSDSQLHIGKSSAGWCFSLHVIPEEGRELLEYARQLEQADYPGFAERVDAYRPPAPAYGSDLNLWEPIYAKLDAISDLEEHLGNEPDRMFCEELENIVCGYGGNLGLLMARATAADRLRALCAVLDQMEGRG